MILMVRVVVSSEEPAAPITTEDVAAPNRERRHVAVRTQKVAADLEQQIYAEAARDSSTVVAHYAKVQIPASELA